MQSVLIASKNKEKGVTKAFDICRELKIEELDITREEFEKTAGIEDVRNIHRKIFLKPIRGRSKAVILASSNGFTIEAQNALLKILEEPPENTIIILVVQSTNLLPTVLSRCKIIELKSEIKIEEQDLGDFLEILNLDRAGKRLKIAQDFGKTRDEGALWLEKMILGGRKKLLEEIAKNKPFEKTAKVIKKLQEAHTIIKTTNVSPRLILENTLISL